MPLLSSPVKAPWALSECSSFPPAPLVPPTRFSSQDCAAVLGGTASGLGPTACTCVTFGCQPSAMTKFRPAGHLIPSSLAATVQVTAVVARCVCILLSGSPSPSFRIRGYFLGFVAFRRQTRRTATTEHTGRVAPAVPPGSISPMGASLIDPAAAHEMFKSSSRWHLAGLLPGGRRAY